MPQYQLCLGIMPITISRGSSNQHVLPTDWVLLLIHSCETKCDWFFSSGGPRMNTTYARKWLKDQHFREANCFERFEYLGALRDKDVRTVFLQEWERTSPGPSQFFTLRFLTRLVKHGLIGQTLVDELMAKAEYSLYEWKCNRDKLGHLDQAFVDGREEDMCWA